MRAIRLPIVAAVLVAPVAVQLASAQEVCVQCEGPVSRYRCTIAEADKVGQFKGRGKAMEYVCVTELARIGRHERCRVNRDAGNVCLGEQRVLSLSGPSEAPTEAAANGAVEAGEGGRAKNEPPRTLVEAARNTVDLSKKTAKDAGDQIGQAGEAVGGAVKKTWNCLVTLFSAC